MKYRLNQFITVAMLACLAGIDKLLQAKPMLSQISNQVQGVPASMPQLVNFVAHTQRSVGIRRRWHNKP